MSDRLFLLNRIVGRSESELAFKLIDLITSHILDSSQLLSDTFAPNLIQIGKHHVDKIVC